MPKIIVPSFLKTAFVIMLVLASSKAEWHHLGKMTAGAPQGNQITFRNPESTVVVTVLAPDLVRVRMVPGSVLPHDYSWAVAKTDWPQPSLEFSGSGGTRVIRTSELEVRINLQPFRIAFYNNEGELIAQDARGMAWDGARGRGWKSMQPGEQYYGRGEKAGPVAKRGHSYVMWNTDPAGYDANTDPMYQTVPFFIALRKGQAYGLFFDNTYRSSF